VIGEESRQIVAVQSGGGWGKNFDRIEAEFCRFTDRPREIIRENEWASPGFFD
jgi:hypothetical protein